MRKLVHYSGTSLNRYSGITSGFRGFFYAIVTENVAKIDRPGNNRQFYGNKAKTEGETRKREHKKTALTCSLKSSSFKDYRPR